MMYTSVLPSYSPVKAIQRPSGENFGAYSLPMPFVSLAASPPSRETIHKSPAYEKTMCVLLNVGSRISRGLFACASAAAASKRMQRRGSNTFFITQSPWDKPALSVCRCRHSAVIDRERRQLGFLLGFFLSSANQILDGTLKLWIVSLFASLSAILLPTRLFVNGPPPPR